MTANEILKNKAFEKDTATLLGSLRIIEAMADARGGLTNEERMVKAAVSDALTERHNLGDAINEIFMDDDFAGNYTDALEIALATVAA